MKILVISPTYNEESLITEVIKGLPDFVDLVIVVDDYSQDSTTKVVVDLASQRTNLHLIKHNSNKGVGAAIKTGYKFGLDHDSEIMVIMAGDNQMNPEDLPRLLDAIVEHGADYSKGNRLFSDQK